MNRIHKPLPSRRYFLTHLVRNFILMLGFVAFSLGIGAAGYHYFAQLPWLEATLNASMILTGMGQDGRLGGAEIVRQGGTIVAQDKATSVVWGMPGAVARSGLCSAVLPLNELGPHVLKLAA